LRHSVVVSRTRGMKPKKTRLGSN